MLFKFELVWYNTCINVKKGGFVRIAHQFIMFIEIKGLEKYYEISDMKSMVLKGLDCHIEKGSLCTILGPSGSGKSTLLNIIGGLDSGNKGEVIVDGMSLENMSGNELSKYRRDKLGFIFQFYNLIPNLTVKENIEVGAYVSDNPLDIDEILELLGLEEHKNKFPNQLSGGQQQRTSIGRAIIKNPSLLICDEPTGALDYHTAKDVLSLIQKLNEKYQMTILIATHNQELKKISNLSLGLHDGLISEVEVNENVCDARDLVW